MTKLTLPIGRAEKHIVDVTASVFGRARVRLAGKPISTFDMRGRLKLVKFYVGDKESHGKSKSGFTDYCCTGSKYWSTENTTAVKASEI